MIDVNKLLNTKQPFLTDGGFETWLFFQQGFEAPEFAAICLMDDENACTAMRRYFDGFLQMAADAGTGFVLDTNTWRGCTQWAPKLGLTEDELLRMSRKSIGLAKDIKSDWQHSVSPILVNGVVGPAGDGYASSEGPGSDAAHHLHRPQMEVFAEEGVDMISALTMANVGEAIGIVRAAEAVGLPVVISFTVETDGRLPTGETLGDAIRAVDAKSDAAPIYYMVNCAHPDHFAGLLTDDNDWRGRIGAVRANASRMSHEELDNSEVLDEGNPEEFGHLHAALAANLPGLKAVGGCCGTDHRHIGHVSGHLHGRGARQTAA